MAKRGEAERWKRRWPNWASDWWRAGVGVGGVSGLGGAGLWESGEG